MFDKKKYDNALASYKRDFINKQWPNEKYKWEAVKCFQDNWDINAKDFAEMIKKSFAKTSNLLSSYNNFPATMIIKFATIAPEETRAMFIDLFDETKDIIERVDRFKNKANELLAKYTNDKSHYQKENAITTYLWLRYPDKYYIYKYGEVKKVFEILDESLIIKKGEYVDNLRSFFIAYDEICNLLSKDEELVSMLKGQLTDSCYKDPAFKTLTIDFGFYISRYYSEEIEEWFPNLEEYDPGLTKEDWLSLLEDNDVFDKKSIIVLNHILECGGQATCTQLADKYGNTKNFYNKNASALAKRVIAKTGCSQYQNDEETKYWPVLFIGKKAQEDDTGSYIWKLRDELKDALITYNSLNDKVKSEEGDNKNYWWLNANPSIWSFDKIAVGEKQAYTLYNESGHKRKVFQHFLDAKIGDPVICYESHPVKQIVGLGRISSEQDGEKIVFQKIEVLADPIDFATIKNTPELENMEFINKPNGTLFVLKQEEYETIIDIIRESNPVENEVKKDKYSKEDYLAEVYMTNDDYNRLKAILEKKKNIILQGPPGVGKTFAAKRLAYSLIGEKNDDQVEMVQFHQNYSYEDFVMGLKPDGDTFAMKYGIFYRFVRKAMNHPEKNYYMIIDEINRGNLSKIFGELLMLIENNYRGEENEITLAYIDQKFYVPDNLYIIGMMNTADRSLAMIDYALRRRFAFFKMEPGFNTEGFTKYQNELNNEMFNKLIEKIKELNQRILNDKVLGQGFCIGHSYFCNLDKSCSNDDLKDIIDYDILPTLDEYWFDDRKTFQLWENELRGIFQ